MNVLCVPEDYRHADGQERIYIFRRDSQAEEGSNTEIDPCIKVTENK